MKKRTKKRPTYTELLTDDKEFEQEAMLFFEPSEISKIQEIDVEMTERTNKILNGIREYVKENKKDYQRSLEEIEKFSKQDVGNQVNTKLLSRTFFKLLEESVFGEVTSSKYQNNLYKTFWNIYRDTTYVKNDIDYNINQQDIELLSHEAK
ncbi:hypothetical protein Glove_9g62 [Diversispora epigaea]|uniref:Uncharacterized protein n=1 Tax=Diversispora epigaea TaxID=1348612 RepID=A0A397JYW9_9GLOM|nr:hypothetical protein Glove_9g62 [Diversispora epigaea]